jgi:hypothetical protein
MGLSSLTQFSGMETPMVPEEPARREEIESIDRLTKLIVEEKDLARFYVLSRELEELFQKEQERRARQIHASKYPTAP